MAAIEFEILAAYGQARVGRVRTPHGEFVTPAFMPVGTQGTVKGLLPDLVGDAGSEIILANTYHLMLRPGSELIAKMGGLHQWTRWRGRTGQGLGNRLGLGNPSLTGEARLEGRGGSMLTDSGGFQVFSLADISKINEDGVVFKSHLDGATIELTPERSIQVQNELGADIIMAFDDCPPASGQGGDGSTEPRPSGSGGADEDEGDNHGRNPSPPLPHGRGSDGTRQGNPPLPDGRGSVDPTRVQQACERTVRWLDRCVKAHARPADQGLFGIVQGGTDLERRDWCLERVCQHDLPGYAIGGVAVGEGYEGLKRVVEHVAPKLPWRRPRYLMGVGYERDIVTAVKAGVDMFDCVLPTRNGRNANAFTPTGPIRLRNARFARDALPIDPGCDCLACAGGYSRSYLRHLFQAEEMLGPILVSLHNIRHFHRLMLDIRAAILHNDWSLVAAGWPVAQG